MYLSYFYLLSFIKAFILTYGVESGISCLCYRKKPLRILMIVLLCNCFSLPVVWFVLPFLIDDYFRYVFVAEVFAVLSESYFLKRLLPTSSARGLLVSLTMNVASFLAGWFFSFLITS